MGKRRGLTRAALVLGLASAAALLADRRAKAARTRDALARAPAGTLPRPPRRGLVLSWRQEALRLREQNDQLYERTWRLVEENSRLRATLEGRAGDSHGSAKNP